jgi:hypothetical protein
MTKSGISINVTGGAANFGNVSQGDRNDLRSGDQALNAQVETAMKTFDAALDARLAERPDDQDQIEALRRDVAALQAEIAKKPEGAMSRIGAAAKQIYENYKWAGPLLKTLFAVIVPGLAL